MKRTPDRKDTPPTPAPEADVEAWDPCEHEPGPPAHPRGFRRRLTASVPGAVGGVFLVCALAFGATLQPTSAPGPAAGGGTDGTAAVGTTADQVLADAGTYDRHERMTDAHPGGDAIPADEGTGDGPEVGSESRPDGGSPAVDEPAPPAPETKPETKPEPKPEPKPDPKPAALGLTLSVKEGAISIDFTECTVDGAEIYKVVRSTDETVRWPLGDGDTLVAVLEVGGKTIAWDEHAPAGKKAWYRVFCVRHTGDGYKVLTSSPVRSITAPAKDPAPAPCHMSIEVGQEAGHAVVHWSACGGETFSHYRILRKTGDSAVVVKEIENAGTTTWVDESVEIGGTYAYLVQSKALVGGSYVLLGSTDWASVTVE